MKHEEQIKVEHRPDGSMFVKHVNGATHLIPASRFMRWALRELKNAMTLPRLNDKRDK